MPEFFTGIFSEVDYANAQLPKKPISFYSHKPVLSVFESGGANIPLIPFAVITQVVNREVFTFVHRPNPSDFNSWSLGIGSRIALLPTIQYGMLDLMTAAETKALKAIFGYAPCMETIHRCLSYSSFVLHDTINSAPLIGLVHRLLLRRNEIPLTPTATGLWVQSEVLHQMLTDGLFDIWSEMLLEEEFV